MDKAPIKNSEPLRAWALVVAGEAVTTTKAVIANAWRAAGLEVTELTAAHPAQQGLDALTQAARDVVAERQRQINTKGYTADNDDGYEQGELPCAAITYAMHAAGVEPKVAAVWWPWEHDAFRPATPRRMLVKAAALLLADIEREDRAAAQAKQGEQANG